MKSTRCPFKMIIKHLGLDSLPVCKPPMKEVAGCIDIPNLEPSDYGYDWLYTARGYSTERSLLQITSESTAAVRVAELS